MLCFPMGDAPVAAGVLRETPAQAARWCRVAERQLRRHARAP
ncbi:hypothetical protein RGE_34360 [Rubrivivax gelatinosus IL144]|uniref:Uncharacterized protein n=1 Tax=Rubrivivax gelatinosus (strain NBRC 100245 / IL144) TaxID=983917 RepID=I0HUT8_RUBGI|nr:hypothetical protein RGE_34360 [Rubrivivax gelatinosus IL144]